MTQGLRGEEDGRAAASARASADQSGRKGIAGAVQQFGDVAPQFGGVHSEFHLHLPEWGAGKAAYQRHREPRAREEDLAGIGGEYLAPRSAVRADQGSARRQ